MGRTKLIRKDFRCYDEEGRYMFTLFYPQEITALINDVYWGKDKETWVEYREKAKPLTDMEEETRHRLLQDIIDAYNEKYNLNR